MLADDVHMAAKGGGQSSQHSLPELFRSRRMRCAVRTWNGHSHDVLSASGVSDDAPSWNFIPPDASQSNVLAEDPELERYLVAEIARATRRRPLMKRLARVEAEFSELPEDDPGRFAPAVPPPLPPLSATGPIAHQMPGPSLILPIDQLMDEFGDPHAAPPASAEWLRKARRNRRRSRARTFFAWSATLAIGAAIVAMTMHGLPQH
jgi:hypothetical protein